MSAYPVRRRAILAAALGSSLLAALAGPAAAEEAIRLGLVTSMTGGFAATGRQVAAGAQLAADEINAAGGIGGRQVKLIVEDDRSEPGAAVNAYNKIISSGPVAVIGPTFTPFVLALAPAVRRAEVPLFTAAIGTKVTAAEVSGGWVFRISTSDAEATAKLADYVATVLKPQRPAILFANNDYGKSGAGVMRATLAAHGIAFAAEEQFTQGDKDMSAQLLKLREIKPDLVVIWAIPTDAGVIVPQARQIGLSVPLVGSPGFATPEFLGLAGSSAEGATTVIVSLAGQSEATADWTQKIRAANPDMPVSFTASTAYDAANLVFDILARQPDATPAKLRDLLAAAHGFQGISGPYDFDATGNGFHQALVVTWTGGKLVPEAGAGQ